MSEWTIQVYRPKDKVKWRSVKQSIDKMNNQWREDRMREWESARKDFTQEWVVEVRSGDHWDDGQIFWHPWYEATRDAFMSAASLEDCINRVLYATTQSPIVTSRPEDYRFWNVVTDERIPLVALGI